MYLRRVLMSNLGHESAFYRGSIFDFSDHDGFASHAATLASNGRGKTTMLAMVFSVFDPQRDRFVQTLQINGHKFPEYLCEAPGIVAVELEDPLVRFPEPRRFVVGWIQTRSREDKNTMRQFFSFPVFMDRSLDNLPWPGTSADPVEHVRTWDDVVRFKKQWSVSRVGMPGTTFIDNQKHWITHMEEDLGIPVALIVAQTQLCRTEGGLAELFKKIDRNSDVLKTLTQMFGLDLEATKVAKELRLSTQKLASRPILERDIKALDALYERVASTNEKSLAFEAGKKATFAAMNNLSEYGRFIQRHALGLQDQAETDRSNVALLASSVAALEKEILGTEAKAEIFRILEVEALLRAREVELEGTTRELLEIDQSLAAINISPFLTELEDLKNKIAVKAETVRVMEEGAEIQIGPVKEAGSRYALVLKRDMTILSQEISELRAKLSEIQAQIDTASNANRGAENAVIVLNSQLEMISSVEKTLEDILARSAAQGLRYENESVADAVERIEAIHSENNTRLEDSDAHREECRTEQTNAIQRATDLTYRVNDAAERHQNTSEALAARLEENAAFEERDDVKLLFVNGSAEPLASNTAAYLAEKVATKKANIERTQAELSDKKALLEAYEKGHSRRDDNLQLALAKLEEQGIKAYSAATYVSNTIKDAGRAKELVESDVGRLFHGIIVESAADLEKVRALNTGDFKLDAPVHVSLLGHAHDAGATAFEHVVMSPWSNAAYHKATLEDEKAFLQEEVHGIGARLQASLAEQETIKYIVDLHNILLGKERELPLYRLQVKEDETRDTLDRLKQELDEAQELVEPCRSATVSAEQAYELARAEVNKSNRQAAAIGAFHTSYHTETNKLSKFEARSVVDGKIAVLNQEIAARQKQINDWKLTQFTSMSKLETLQNDMRDLRHTERNIAHRDDHDYDIYDLTRDVAETIYNERNAAFLDEFKSLSHHQQELAGYKSRLDEVTVNFEQSIEDTIHRFEGLDSDALREQCRSYSTLSDGARRQEMGTLSDRRKKTEALRLEISGIQGELRNQKVEKPTALSKKDRRAFDDLFTSIRLGHNNIGAADAHQIMEDCRFELSELHARHESLKTEHDVAVTALEKLAAWANLILAETRRTKMASAIASDYRSDEELQFAFAEPESIGVIQSTINDFEEKITTCERREKTVESEFSTAKQKLLMLCMDGHFGVLSATTVSAMEKYRLNAQAQHWYLDAIELQKIRTSIDALEFSISKMEEDEERSISELTNLLNKCMNVFKRATSMRIPDKAGRFGGVLIMKSDFHFNQVTEESKRLTAKQHLDDLIERNRSEEGLVVEGAALVNGLLMKLAQIEGKKDGFKFEILVPIIQNKTETYRNLAEMKGSGGQVLTSAFLLYVLTASIRNATSGKQVGGVFLLLDNPLGAASAKELVQAQVQVAEAMNIQLVIVTPSNDSDPLSCFNVLNSLHLGRPNGKRVPVSAMKESHDVLTARHIFHLSEAA